MTNIVQQRLHNELETMHHNIIFSDNFLAYKEITDVFTLISLELNYFSVLLVIDNRTVASKALLPRLQNQLKVQIFSQTLNGGNTLASISLLNTNMFR